MIHCWNCHKLLVFSMQPPPPAPPPPPVEGEAPSPPPPPVKHLQIEITCRRCGWMYEITVVQIGQREPQPPVVDIDG
jgi:hypothetical protein